MTIPYHRVQELAELIERHCNLDQDSHSLIQERLWVTLQRGTYRLRFDSQEQIIGYCDYDLSPDGMLHVRKLVGLRPGVAASLMADLKQTIPWKRVFFYRARTHSWRHHGRPWRYIDAMA